MGYGLLRLYGLWSTFPCEPTWWTQKGMEFKGVWGMWAMGYKGVNCTQSTALNLWLDWPVEMKREQCLQVTEETVNDLNWVVWWLRVCNNPPTSWSSKQSFKQSIFSTPCLRLAGTPWQDFQFTSEPLGFSQFCFELHQEKQEMETVSNNLIFP